MTVVPPPVQADLLGLVDRAHDEADADREELDFGERDLDVTGHDQALVEDPIEHIDESAGSAVRCLEIGSHSSRPGGLAAGASEHKPQYKDWRNRVKDPKRSIGEKICPATCKRYSHQWLRAATASTTAASSTLISTGLATWRS